MLGLMAVKMMAAADKLTIWDRERSRKEWKGMFDSHSSVWEIFKARAPCIPHFSV